MSRQLALCSLKGALAGAVLAALIGCGDDPELALEPNDELITAADDDAGSGSGSGSGSPEPREVRGERKAADLVIKMEAFSEEVMGLKPKDLVEIALKRGTFKATVTSVRARLLTVTTHGTSIISRFRPEEVESVRLLYREDPAAITFSGDSPLNEEETWLERFADRAILGQDPGPLWKDRFARNTPLTVTRGFRINTVTFLNRRGTKNYFLAEKKPEVIKKHDQIKLVGTTKGLERKLDGGESELGEVQLYLVRRGQNVRLLCSRDTLAPNRIKASALERFLRSEPVVLAVGRPGSTKHLKIVRVPASTALKYREAIRKAPARSELRRLRAVRSKKLKRAEQQILAIYRGLGLEDDSDQDEPIAVRLRVPSTEGGVHLERFEKELGLD